MVKRSREEKKNKQMEDIITIIRYHNKLRILSILLVIIVISTNIFNLLSTLVFKSYINLLIGLLFEFVLLLLLFLLNIIGGRFFDIFVAYTIEKDDQKWKNVRSEINEIREFVSDIDDFVKKYIEKNAKKNDKNNEDIVSTNNNRTSTNNKTYKKLIELCDEEDEEEPIQNSNKERLID